MPEHSRPYAPSLGALLSLALWIAAAWTLSGWWRDGATQPLPEAPATRLDCVSYAPSGAGSTPPAHVQPERIRRDLALLAQRFHCVRTYSVDNGLDRVPAIARELGLQVLLGAWIGSDAVHNERELALAIDTARRDRDVIRAVVVGNEVLLRHDLAPDQLARLIDRVREATGLPVTYADVWGLWLKHRGLARSVSFVTVHVLPYWDDDPVGIDRVIPYVEGLYQGIRRAFPDKPVLIGETGWPSAGRARGPNVPGRVNQARYLRAFTALAQSRGIPYNLIEAFDQPWKSLPEGTVGGHWGLYDDAGRAKFPWTGPVAEAPQGRRIALAGLLCAAFAGLAAFTLARGRRVAATLQAAPLAALSAAIAARQWQVLTESNVTAWQWIGTLPVLVIGWLLFGRVALAHLRQSAVAVAAPRPLLLLLLAAGAYVCLGLVFAGRHRDFPTWLFMPGVMGLATCAWLDARALAARLRAWRATEEAVLAAWLAGAGVLIVLVEGRANVQAIAWAVSALALGLGVLLPLALQPRDHQRAEQHADT